MRNLFISDPKISDFGELNTKCNPQAAYSH